MKILITTTISDTVIAFLIPHIEQLVCAGYTVDVAFSIKHKLPEKLIELVRNVYNLPFQRNPFHYRNLIAFKAIIGSQVQIGIGTVIMAGVTINCSTQIGI